MKIGGKLYITDTDSLVTDIQLPYFLIDSYKILEHKILEGYFQQIKPIFSSKLDRIGKNIIKGVQSDRLTFYIKRLNFYHATYVSIKNFLILITKRNY